jgi:CRISPR/Cas system-associated protein Csm6
MSTHVESVANPLIAACEGGFVPDSIALLSNEGVEAHVSPVCELFEATTAAYGSEATVDVTTLDGETDFEGIVDHIRTPIDSASDGDAVAVDVTPGRKFMSAIAFQAGMQFGADHVYYLYLDSDAYFGVVFPDIPTTAAELIDFTEVFA